MPLDEVSGESNYLVAGQESNSPASWWRPQRTLPAIACLCMLFGALLTSGRAPARHYLLGGHVGKIEQLFTDDDPCKDFDYISIDRVIHKNLGNAGPDSGAEGMVYEGMDKKRGEPGNPVVVVMNATSLFTSKADCNGMNGDYAAICCQGNTDIAVTFKFYDGVTMNPLILPQLYFTFFDLDTHRTGNEVEYVRIWDYKDYVLTKNTLVSANQEVDGSTTLIATVPGTGQDNPEDPLLLTSEQKNKAVTVEYQDKSEFRVQFGSNDKVDNLVDRWFRVFLFVAKPSLLCGKTQGEDTTGGVDVVPKSSTITTTTSIGQLSTTTEERRKCWFVIPIINWCFPKLF